MEDLAGAYELVSVNGLELPATVDHGDASLEVRSGLFTIDADGGCESQVTFVPPSGQEFTREVRARYTQKGAELEMQWEGAGRTTGRVEGDRFTMANEGMAFEYRKRPAMSGG